MVKEIVLIIIGFVFLVKGADFLVKSATSIAKRFGLSEIVIGLTIVAIGTSLPEIFITITSSIEGHSDLIISNAIGSCICNFLLVIGLTSLVRPVKFDKRIVKIHLPIGMTAMILILILGNTNSNTVTRWQGVVLLLLTVIYIIYTIYEEKKLGNKKINEEIINDVKDKENYNMFGIILFAVLGVLGLKFGSDFVVDNALLIASGFGLSESFMGMTIVACRYCFARDYYWNYCCKKKRNRFIIRKYIRFKYFKFMSFNRTWCSYKSINIFKQF